MTEREVSYPRQGFNEGRSRKSLRPSDTSVSTSWAPGLPPERLIPRVPSGRVVHGTHDKHAERNSHGKETHRWRNSSGFSKR